MKNTPSYLNASVRALLIDDKTEYLIANRPVVWYNLIHGKTENFVFLLREDIILKRKLAALTTFSLFLHPYFEPETHSNTQLMLCAPGAHRDDVCSWPGFSKTLRMIQRSNSKCVFKFNTEKTLMKLPEYKSAFVFQRSDCLLFEGVSRLRVGLRRMRIGSMEYFGPRVLFRSTEHLKERL